MKTIVFDRPLGRGLVEPLSVDLVADSAIVVAGKPVFVPDFTDRWSAQIYVVFKVSRLGKSISEKFSHRYYEEATLGLRLVPDGAMTELKMSGGKSGLGGLFDGCLALGRWMPADGGVVELKGSGIDVELDLLSTGIGEALAAVSNVATMKMGDLIAVGVVGAPRAVAIGDRFTVEWNKQPCLDVKLK